MQREEAGQGPGGTIQRSAVSGQRQAGTTAKSYAFSSTCSMVNMTLRKETKEKEREREREKAKEEKQEGSEPL